MDHIPPRAPAETRSDPHCVTLARTHLRTIYGDEPLPGVIGIWTYPNKQTSFHRTVESAAEAAVAAADQTAVYYCTGLRREGLGAYQRGTAEDVVAVSALWMDIDVQNPQAHKQEALPPTFTDAIALLNTLPLRPSLVVNSGHGLQAYWVLKEVWMFGSDAERQRAAELLARLQGQVRAEARKRGWKLDNTGDLARVLRVPGTYNRKSTPVLVDITHEDLARYVPDDFEILPAVEYVPAGEGRADDGDFEPAQMEPILAGCGWMREGVLGAKRATEPVWYRLLSIVARCEGGVELAHQISTPHPGYNRAETDAKLQQALDRSGPATCLYISDKLESEHCKACPNWNKVRSPIVLGRPANPLKLVKKPKPTVATPNGHHPDVSTLIARVCETRDVGAAFDAVPALATLPAVEFGKVKAQLKSALGDRLNLNDLHRAVKEARKEQGAEPQTGTVPVKDIADAIKAKAHFAQNSGGKLYVYQHGVYTDRGAQHVKQRVKALLVEWGRADDWSSHKGEETVEFIRLDAPILWEKPPLDIINVRNGLLNVETREICPHSPEHLSPVQLPVTYDPQATCPQMKAFVAAVFPEDAQELAWEIPAHLMTPSTSIQKAVLLKGEGGNGKSTYLSALVAFIGSANCASLSLQRLEEDKFSVARLAGKLANVCADLPSKHLESTSIFKSLTGSNEAITGEYKHGDHFEFVPYSRLIFSANHPPRSSDASWAFFRRWLVVPFDRTFSETAEEHVKREVLDARLADPAEQSGVLNKALDALPRLREHGFTESESMRAAFDEFRTMTDPLSVWLDNETIDAPNAWISKKELHAAFNKACQVAGRPQKTTNAFGRELRKLRPELQEAQRVVGGVMAWVWVGIGLRTKPEYDVAPEGSKRDVETF